MNAIPVVSRCSVRTIISPLALIAAVFLGWGFSTQAQTVAFTNNPVTTTYGGASDNGPGLNIGVTFTVTGAGIEVFQLGAFDWQGDGLNASHTVTLFQNENALASVTVPAGTSAPLLGGFRFAPLTSPIYLPAGTYAVVSYQMNGANAGNDPYGENNASGFNGGGNVSAADGVFQFTTAGTPLYPNNVDGGYDFQSASFTYTNVASGTAATWTGGGANGDWNTAGNWTAPLGSPAPLTFAGSTRLVNTNNLTAFTATSLTFDAAAGAFVLDGNGISLSGNLGFGANPATPVTQTINLNMAWSVNETIDTPTNGDLTLNGNITSSASLTKIDGGTLTLGGTNLFASLGDSGGTNIITGSTTFNGPSVLNADRFYIADGDSISDCKATVIIQPGANLSVTGNYGDAGVLGRDGGSATVIQNGGTFSFNMANQTSLFIGASGNTATRSEYDMNGGLFNMNGETLGIALGANTVITGLLNQVGGVITNVGNLYLDPFFTQGYGIYNLTGGTIYIGSGGITVFAGGSYQMNLGGGTIAAQTSWTSSVNLNLTGNNGPVTFNPAGNTITLSGVLSGTGGLNVSGGGILELSGPNTYAGVTTVGAGSVLQLDDTGSSAGAVEIANGGLLNLNYTGNYAVGGFYTNGVALPIGSYNSANLPGFITGSGNLQVASGISTGLWTGNGANSNWSTGGNWDNNAVPVFPHALTFAGNSHLVNNNDLSGITVSSLTFDSAAGAFVLNGNDITLPGNIGFNANPAAPITQTVNLNLTWTADKTIDTPTNGNLSLGGNITSGYSLTKIDAGTLTLDGDDSFDGYFLNGGTNIITGDTTFNGNGTNLFYLGNGSTNFDGTLIIQPGAQLNITGTFADAGVIGRNGGSGTIIQNGGTFTFNPANQSYLFVGATSDSGTRGVYDMNGGTLDLSGYTLGIALSDGGVLSTGVVNQVGGQIANVFDLDLGAVRLYGYGVYNLTGGTITIDIGGITSDSGLYALNLGGGTIAASSTWSSHLNATLTGSNGPVTFSPNGNTITLSGNLSGPGGLIVAGGGTLELSGANSYTGDTLVNSGILQLDTVGSSAGAFRVANGSQVNLNFGGTYVVGGLYTNGVAPADGTYTASNLPGFIVGSGSLQVVGGVSTGLWTGQGANANWSTAANWNNDAVPIFPITLTFAGSSHLVNNNDLSSITAGGITFDAAAGAFVIGGNDITLSGTIGFNGNPATTVTQTINLNMAWSNGKTIDTPANGNLTLGGNITSSSDTSLVKTDAGTLTLGGANNSLQSWDLNGGTTVLTGNTTVNGAGNSRIYVADGDAAANGAATLTIQSGATLSILGNYADAMVIGRDSGSGTVNQNGGTFSFNPANQSYLFIGASGSSATRSAYNMNGGVLDMTGKTLGIALGANAVITGLVNQVSGVITNVANLYFDPFFTQGYGIYNLTGGSIYIGSGGITVFAGGSYQMNLGGGTIAAQATWSSALNMNLTGINGAVTFNPAGNTITLSGVLSGTGGLTVAGGGTLELSGANTYTGTTLVNSGTLQLDSVVTSSSALKLVTGAALNLNFSGTLSVASFSTNNVALSPGTYTASNLPGFITGSGSIQVLGGIPMTPTTITFTAGNGHINLSWPANYQGWILQTQTNSLNVGISTNWVDVAGSASLTSTSILINTKTPTAFYRLRYPTP